MGYIIDPELESKDQGQASYEPSAYYRLRRVFRRCVTAFLVCLSVALLHLLLGRRWITRGQLVVVWSIVALSLAVVVVVFIGMVLTAPKGRRRRDGSAGSTDKDWWIDDRKRM